MGSPIGGCMDRRLCIIRGIRRIICRGWRAGCGESGARQSWCIFDNTASGEALRNALALVRMEQGVV